MDLFLIRHGQAESRAASDEERSLTAAGVETLKQEAAGLSRLGVHPAAILASPLRRAQQTAEVLRESLGLSAEIVSCTGLAYGDHESVLIEIGALGASSVLVVGHLPLIGELASILLVGDERAEFSFEPGAVLHVAIDRAPAISSSILRWHLTPAQLVAIGE